MTDQNLSEQRISETPLYSMNIDLRVLEHLGINLYSNAAAVISEAVANCWDADASVVNIKIEPDVIVISDDGAGMSVSQLNTRFLKVGYDKRNTEGNKSKCGRMFMGRKGIGKLALFSIADTVIVETCTEDGSVNAFVMHTKDIREAIGKGQPYYPVPITSSLNTVGTTITLQNLRKRATAASVNSLRKRVARRFTVIGLIDENRKTFNISVNGIKVGSSDRDDYNQIEFVWSFGSQDVPPANVIPNLKKRAFVSEVVSELKPDWTLKGWIGTVAEPKQLKNVESGNIKGIVVVARGRLIQENILEQLSFAGLMSNYITGQIEADFLDRDDEADIATSDRQRLIEDDDRYVSLITYLRTVLLEMSGQWSEWRNEARGKQAEEENPGLKQWLANLPSGQVAPARKLLGVVRGIQIDNEESRLDLYRASVTAFERLRLKEASHKLSELGTLDALHLLPLLSDLASLESALYSDIVKSRLQVIRKFEEIVDSNEKEKVLQEHLFKDLWLLDPAWERASGSDRVEQALKTEYPEFSTDLSDEQSKGRIDIRYKTNGGEHILVELKRADRVMTTPELLEQGQKYIGALRTILARQGFSNPFIRLIFVLGVQVKEESELGLGPEHVKTQLRGFQAEHVYYDQLIKRARDQYAEYIEKQDETNKIDQILQAITSESKIEISDDVVLTERAS